MSDPARSPQGEVEAYLARLHKALAGLPAGEVEDILREIRGHIAERAAQSDPGQDSVPVGQILRQLGAADHIGSLYRADAQLAHARATFSPSLIVGSTIRCATRTLAGFVAFLVGMTGYALGLSLTACALLKPFLPAYIGLWIGPGAPRADEPGRGTPRFASP